VSRTDHPTVVYSTLCDGHNIQDQKFKDEVNRFMERSMPGGPMGLLSTHFERWEILMDPVHSVEEIERTLYTCTSCGLEVEKADEVCCRDEEEEPEPVKAELHAHYVIRNEKTAELVTKSRETRHLGDEDIEWRGIANVLVWQCEEDAERDREELDQSYFSKHGNEGHGFPWAHGWWHLPEQFIKDEELQAAGFTVATYTGGDGDTRNDDQFRLCGIDGGGYGFFEVHFAKLYAIVASNREWTTETEQGTVYITMDERSELRQIAEEGAKAQRVKSDK
jgi:hypothetical protein